MWVTEGFVPPEGPGSAQADVYSLGKVLYEIATGKDRMDFRNCRTNCRRARSESSGWDQPCDLPKAVRSTYVERKISTAVSWQMLCAVSSTEVSRRRGAEAFSGSRWCWAVLPHSVSGNWPRQVGLMVVCSAVTTGGGGSDELHVSRVAIPKARMYWTTRGAGWCRTPTGTLTAKIGERVSVVIRKGGFKPLEASEVVGASSASEPILFGGELQIFSPPEIGAPWEDHLGNPYQPKGDEHVGVNYANESSWRRYVNLRKWRGMPRSF